MTKSAPPAAPEVPGLPVHAGGAEDLRRQRLPAGGAGRDRRRHVPDPAAGPVHDRRPRRLGQGHDRSSSTTRTGIMAKVEQSIGVSYQPVSAPRRCAVRTRRRPAAGWRHRGSVGALPEPGRAHPARRAGLAGPRGGWSDFWDAVTTPDAVAALKLTVVGLAAGGRSSTCVRHADRLGAGARRLPRQERRQRPDRPAVRAADDRRRPGAARAVRPAEPGRRRRGLHPGRRRAGAAVRDAAVRRAHACSRCCSSSTARWSRRPRRSARSRSRSSGGSCCPTCCRRSCPAAALAFARAIGEFGSTVLISGNMPFQTQVAPV